MVSRMPAVVLLSAENAGRGRMSIAFEGGVVKMFSSVAELA
jgi:hypothetical protein